MGRLVIKGKLNGADLKVIKEHTGRLSNLQVLDLSDVTLVPDNVCYASSSYGFSGFNFYLSDADSVHVRKTSSSMFADASGAIYTYYTMDLGGLFGEYRGSNVMPSLKHVALPKNATGIGAVMFEGCKNLVSISVPKSVTKIGPMAFYDCRQLRTPDFGELTEIGFSAFTSTDSIDAIDLSHVTRMGTEAFYGSSIRKADLSSLDTIPDHAFGHCAQLDSVKFSPTLKVIGEWVFSDGCTRLTSLTLPETVTTIGKGAFYNSPLASINAPASLINVGSICLTGTPWLEAQTGEDGVIYFGNVALKPKEYNMTSLTLREGTVATAAGFVSGNDDLTSVTLPSTLRYIGAESFNGCDGLTTIALPQSLDSIGENAFYSCAALTTVNLPPSLVSIGDNAFYGCKGLTQVTLPEGLRTVGNYAFEGSGLGSVTVPEGVTRLGMWAFSTSTLIRVNFNARHAERGDYKSSDVYYGAFSNCDALERVTIGPEVEFLQEGLFSLCKNLSRVTFTDRKLPADRTASIDSASFAAAKPLVIGDYAFRNCSAWTDPSIPFGTTYIGQNAFQGVSFPNVWLPYGVETITGYGTSSFVEGSNIEEASLPPTLKNVNHYFLSPRNGSNLRTVYDYMTAPYVDADGNGLCLGDYRDSVTLYVLPGLLEAYKTVGDYYNHDKERWNYKAVLEMDAADVPTAIRKPAVDGKATSPAVYYDLQGRRVTNPRPGLYIVNGRKVVLR